MDIGLALTYITRDREWIKKVAIGGLISLIPIVGSFVLYGYALRILRNVVNAVEQPLPEWNDFGGDLVNGFLAAVGVFLWGLPLFVLFFCFSILGSLSDTGSLLSFLAFCLLYPLLIVYFAVVPPIILGRFAMSGNNFSTMLQFNEVIQQIQSVKPANYVMLFVLALVCSILAPLGLIACFIGVIFTSAYANYALAHGAGQLYRQSLGGSQAQPQSPAF